MATPTNSEWSPLPLPARVHTGRAPGPPKLRVVLTGRPARPMALLTKAAVDHLVEAGCTHVTIEAWPSIDSPAWQTATDRRIRIHGHREALPGSRRIRVSTRLVAWSTLTRIGPPGTDIPLEAVGDDLVGVVPDDVAAAS